MTDYREDLHLYSHGSSLLLDSRSQAHISDNVDIRKSEALSEKQLVVEKQEAVEAWERLVCFVPTAIAYALTRNLRKRSHNTV